MTKSSFVILVFILALGCGPRDYQKLANKKLDEGVDCADNRDGNLVLCKSEIPGSTPTAIGYKFIVFEKESGKIMYEDQVNRGSVKWLSSREIEVANIPGTIPQGKTMQDYILVIDVYSKVGVKKTDRQLD